MNPIPAKHHHLTSRYEQTVVQNVTRVTAVIGLILGLLSIPYLLQPNTNPITANNPFLWGLEIAGLLLLFFWPITLWSRFPKHWVLTFNTFMVVVQALANQTSNFQVNK